MSEETTTVHATRELFNQLVDNKELPVTGVVIHLEVAGQTAMRLAGGNAAGLEGRVPDMTAKAIPSRAMPLGRDLMRCQVRILDQREHLQHFGMPDKHDFAIALVQGDQMVFLSENVAAMVHGAIRGVWSRTKGEELPLAGKV